MIAFGELVLLTKMGLQKRLSSFYGLDSTKERYNI